MLRPPTARAAAAVLAAVTAATALAGCQSTPNRVIPLPGTTAVPSASTNSSRPTEPVPTAAGSESSDPSPTLSEPTAAGTSTGTLATPSQPSTPSHSAGSAIDHVVAISVDGLNPDAITDLGPTGTPTFHRLLREGAGTLNARTAREQTRTLPNHTGMLTGRRVAGQQGGHGYTINTDEGSTVERAAGRYVASVFDVVHDRGGSTALYSAKEKFAVYQRTWNRDGAVDRTGGDDGTAKIDSFVVDTDDERLTRRVTADLGRQPAEFTFVHIAAPDEAGHADGFMGTRYLQAVTRTDGMIGQIIGAIENNPILRDHTVMIITADHGGRGPDHDDAGDRDNYRIPFLAWGPGVVAGGDLYRLNPDYRDPGTARSDYSGTQPIRNADLANLATGLLELPRVPGSEFDRRQDLDLSG